MPITIPAGGSSANRIIIATPELSDVATITASQGEGGFPVENLLTNSELAKKWRTTDIAGAVLDIAFPVATTINFLALVGTNNYAGSVQWKAAASPILLPGSTPVATFPHFPEAVNNHDWPETMALKFLTTPITFKYHRITITDLTNPAGYYEAGRLYLSYAFQPTYDVRDGGGWQWVDPSESVRARGGQRYFDELRGWRKAHFELRFPNRDEAKQQAGEIMRRRGSHKDVIVSFDPSGPDAHKETAYCTLEELQSVDVITYGIYGSSFTIEELI